MKGYYTKIDKYKKSLTTTYSPTFAVPSAW